MAYVLAAPREVCRSGRIVLILGGDSCRNQEERGAYL